MDMQQVNIFDEPIEECCSNPITGFFRDGFCHTDQMDRGLHIVCSLMTEEFLDFSKSRGNDLSTPRPEFDFPGLKAGDSWCVCAERWKETILRIKRIEHIMIGTAGTTIVLLVGVLLR